VEDVKTVLVQGKKEDEYNYVRRESDWRDLTNSVMLFEGELEADFARCGVGHSEL
jgi:hypothetical protein